MINQFRGKYRPFSNFWIVNGGIVLDAGNGGLEDGLRYISVEHAYQAAKSLEMNDRIAITRIANPAAVKVYGQTIQLRPDWESVKVPLMLDLVRQKFTNSAELRALLINTGEQELIEGNYWHDTFWGRCTCDRHRNAGENWLGRILMQIRKEL